MGQAVTLLIEGQMEISALGTKLESVLASYYRPKYIYTVNHIPQTGNGKINRKECRVLAESLTVARETGIIKTAEVIFQLVPQEFHCFLFIPINGFYAEIHFFGNFRMCFAFKETFHKYGAIVFRKPYLMFRIAFGITHQVYIHYLFLFHIEEAFFWIFSA